MKAPAILFGSALALSACAPEAEQSEPATETEGEDTVIVVPFDVADDADTEAALAQIIKIRDYLAKQPGMKHQALLKGSTDNVDPEYVHVMRWDERASWDAAIGTEEFAAVIDTQSGLISGEMIEVYIPVE